MGNIIDGFSLAEFIRVPMTERLVEVELTKSKGKGLVKSMSKGMTTMLRSEEQNKQQVGGKGPSRWGGWGNAGRAQMSAVTTGSVRLFLGQDFLTFYDHLVHHHAYITTRTSPRVHHHAYITMCTSPYVHHHAYITMCTSPVHPQNKPLGSLRMKVMFIPFFQPSFDDEGGDHGAEAGGASASGGGPKKAKKGAVSLPSARLVTTKVPAKLKGVLTITLIRYGQSKDSPYSSLAPDDSFIMSPPVCVL